MRQNPNEPSSSNRDAERDAVPSAPYGTWAPHPDGAESRGFDGRGFRGIAWWHGLWIMGLLGVLARFNNAVLHGPKIVTAILIGAAIGLAVRLLVRAVFPQLASRYVWMMTGVAFVATVVGASLLW